MIVTAREFTSAAEMMAAAAAVHRRCFKPKVRPPVVLQLIAPARPVEAEVKAPVKVRYWPKPVWMRQPVMFDEHVIAHRMAKRLLDMQARGEIDIVDFDKRSILQIVTEVLAEFPRMTVPMLKGSGRRREVCLARQTAMYELRQQRPDLSFPMIGRWFGGRDHTTVLHAVRKIEKQRASA